MNEMVCVVGARPNFMKMAPILDALRAHPAVRPLLVHTGQHYDEAMSRVFFEELGLPTPDRNLEIGSDTHARQTGRIMTAFDALLDELVDPRMVVVVGDVNSTMACALVAVKRSVPVAHVEAGLRSRDRAMPEEINRLVTDVVSDLLFATSPDAVENLEAEGIERGKIHLVGNPMIDTLKRHLQAARGRRAPERYALPAKGYAVVTLHRPSNVDEPAGLEKILRAIRGIGSRLPVLFPVHPRTRERMARLGFREAAGVTLCEPLGYLDFLGLMDSARFVLTDSGGIQEETTALGVPCLTLRANTERPITITEGTNRLIGDDPDAILPAAESILAGEAGPPRSPRLWDGRAGERIAAVLARAVEGN
ncbi:MAG TPA: UDP-N-acetylglucosamine 2-epimerase (non-hydrolyzing) [Candidatus Eisenbacteria bacterium]|nr:UDP-N-acetylglucosamine 2-epimerase (non-hydrolyzing) [Candidatus Eisenbacteria bacterium]